MMSDAAFSEPQRQNGFAILVYWFDFMRQFFFRGIYGIIPLVINPEIWWLLLILLILAVFVTGFLALLSFYHFEFYLTREALVIEQGLFNKQGSNIPFERIQTVHLHQNVIQKLLGVQGVKVETAGSQQQETEIKGLSEGYAHRLKQAIKASAPSLDPATEEVASSPHSSSEALVKLSFKDLALVALTDNHLRNGGIILAFVFGTVFQFFPQASSLQGMANETTLNNWIGNNFWVQLGYGMALFIGIVLLVAFAWHIHLYFNFRADLTSEGFQTKGGLLRRNEYTIPFSKIQNVRWATNFIRKPLGMETITLYPAQSAGNESLSNVTIPGCFSAQSQAVMEAVYPDLVEATPRYFIKPKPVLKLLLLGKRLLIGLIAAGIFGYFYSQVWAAGLFLVFMLFQTLNVWRYVESMQLALYNKGIIYREGWLFPRASVIPAHKIQSVQIRQNIVQQRFDTCAFVIGTAAGAFVIPFLPKSAVMPVYDRLLYKTETHRGGWM